MTSYPLRATDDERKYIDGYLKNILPNNLEEAKKQKKKIIRELGKPTGMLIPGKKNLFGSSVISDKILFDSLKDNHLNAILVVALRFKWKPENITALWQNEGLPSSSVRKYENRKPGPFQDVSAWYNGKIPKNKDEARAWARSAILWERWGLDKLAPILKIPGKDNKLKGNARNTEHDTAFRKGQIRECGTYLKASALEYLSADPKPIEVKFSGRKWMFRTHAEYQPTMLALQYARFKNQIKRIPPAYDFGNKTVYTRSIAPAFLYMHYNSRFAEKHLKEIAKQLSKSEKIEYDGTELYEFFVSKPIPKHVLNRIKQTGQINSHSYVNSLRYEFLRRIYNIVFKDFEPKVLPSIYLIDDL